MSEKNTKILEELLGNFQSELISKIDLSQSTIVNIDDLESLYGSLDLSFPFVIPTETVYGLAALITDEASLENIYTLKGRPSDNPLIVHVADRKMLESIVTNIYPEYDILMEKFSPGPLTLVFPCPTEDEYKKNRHLFRLSPKILGNSMSTVAIRIPRDSRLRRFIKKIGIPLAAPSANTSGRPSPTRMEDTIIDFGSKIRLYIDGGMCEEGLESTIFGIHNGKPTLYRPGAISLESIEAAIKKPVSLKTSSIFYPGQKYRHYSPTALVIMFKKEAFIEYLLKSKNAKLTTEEKQKDTAAIPNIEPGLNSKKITLNLESFLSKYEKIIGGHEIGFLGPKSLLDEYADVGEIFNCVFDMGSSGKEKMHTLYAGLRVLDHKCKTIFTIELGTKEEERAVMDRLYKASSVFVTN